MPQPCPNRRAWGETFLQPRPAFPVGVIVLLMASFLYIWLRFEPRLEYHSSGPYFYRQWAFLEPFLSSPGGLTGYAGMLLAQFNCLNWAGALVFVLLECMVLLAAMFWLTRLGGRAPGFAALLPLFGLLLLRNRYGCPVPAISIGLFLPLAASAILILSPSRRPWLFMAVSGLISSLLFWLAGLWSALLFAVLSGLFLCTPGQNWPAGLGCLILGSVAPLFAMGAGGLHMSGLVNSWGQGVNWLLAAALYASVPIAGAVLALLPKTALVSGDPGRTRRLGQAVIVLAFLSGWAAIWLTFDGHGKLLAEINYDASSGQFEEVLAAARRAEVLDDPAKVRVQWALYHTGRLAEDLFSIRSLIEEGPSGGTGEGCRARSQPLFDLGLVNDAEHMACEALVLEGPRPDLLRLLARINLEKGQPRAAQVFLNVLSLIPFQGARADPAWPTMDVQMTAAERALLAPMPGPGLTNDVLHDGLPVGRLLNLLLASHPTNRMAFEYVMADDLLNLDLKGAVNHFRLLDNFDYTRIPRPYRRSAAPGSGTRESEGGTEWPHDSTRNRRAISPVRKMPPETGMNEPNARRPSRPGSGTPIGVIMPPDSASAL